MTDDVKTKAAPTPQQLLEANIKLLEANIHSTDPKQIAYALGQFLLQDSMVKTQVKRFLSESDQDFISRQNRFKHTAQRLTDYVLLPHPAAREESRQAILSEVSKHEYSEPLVDLFARLGHINEIANLVARDNVFKRLNDQDLPVPGGVLELLNRDVFDNVNQAVDHFNKPTLGLTVTGHPTNTNSLASMRVQRELTQAIDDMRYGRKGAQPVIAALQKFSDTPLLPQNDEGKPRKLTSKDEIENMLYFLGNIYDDLPHMYDRFDTPMTAKYKDRYDPAQLKLPIDLSSWGSSGDKDGNKNLTAVTTLQAALMHHLASITRYDADMKGLPGAGLAPWKQRFADEKINLARLLEQLNTTIEESQQRYRQEHDIPAENPVPALLNAAQYDAFAEALHHHTRGFNPVLFQKDLDKAYAETKNDKLLDLSRRFRIFGFTFGRIEYRETAEEYTRVVSQFIPGYMEMDEPTRQKQLNDLLTLPPQALAKRFQNVIKGLEGASNQPYSDKDARPIAYQTLKRMEIARDFPDLITDNVLAECQNTSNFLEALLLQKLVTKNNLSPRLGIVPLFEEYGVLERVDTILGEAFANPAYRAHVDSLNDRHAKPTQQIQLAHSDNARRAGMPAARAYIYDAHKTIRDVCTKHGITPQFFEGGSQSDPYRGGVRAMSASVNEFGIHDFAKFTFQGGDLLNYINYPSSAIRMVTRTIAHRAEAIYNKLMRREPKKPYDQSLDDIAVEALKRTATHYEETFFLNPKLGKFLEELGYLEEADAGNNSLRAGGRSGGSKVDVLRTRTISFSEGFQHAGICPTWIGAGPIFTNLCKAMDNKELSAQELNEFYKKSPVFADVIDRILFGLAMTDLDALGKRHGGQIASSNMYKTFCKEYENAFHLAMEAKTGIRYASMEPNNAEKSYGNRTLTEMRKIVINEALPQLKPDLTTKHHYINMTDNLREIMSPTLMRAEREKKEADLARARDHVKEDKEKGSNTTTAADRQLLAIDERDRTLRQMLHNAGDTALHARWVMADDPATAGLVKYAEEAKTKLVDDAKAHDEDQLGAWKALDAQLSEKGLPRPGQPQPANQNQLTNDSLRQGYERHLEDVLKHSNGHSNGQGRAA